MRKRVLVAVGLLGAGWLVGVVLSPSHRINREGFERIRADMTLADVEAVLGVPDGNYATLLGKLSESTGKLHYVSLEGKPSPNKGMRDVYWTSDQCDISVAFRADGVVAAKFFAERKPGVWTLWDLVKAKRGW